MIVFKIILLFTSFAFAYYGYNCLRTNLMISEFKRFGLTKKQRQLTGMLQIIGATGLVLGLFHSWIGLFASGGLAVLMVLGFGVRLKIKDSFLQAIPSFVFILINGYLFYVFLRLI
ncbi:DoxX family protein [Lacinutrix neustonica]|uniref:DoxX family protein n=1 Tax=Lacinutrix neustonica TaxID=2980107 RepID=A0A9E8SH49_9FLAO|nr:DoxX family protein [Lacinutrix neustonica]WAC02345.1 DoxX family protein [Lacinutrix neustonica]